MLLLPQHRARDQVAMKMCEKRRTELQLLPQSSRSLVKGLQFISLPQNDYHVTYRFSQTIKSQNLNEGHWKQAQNL